MSRKLPNEVKLYKKDDILPNQCADTGRCGNCSAAKRKTKKRKEKGKRKNESLLGQR